MGAEVVVQHPPTLNDLPTRTHLHPRHARENRHPAGQPRHAGCTHAQAVRTYLKEFLSDPRVVEMPRALWWLILNGIILNTRPKKSAAKYASIWLKEGSPLRVYTEKQTSLLQGYLSQRTKAPYVVAHAMRYGNPSIPSVLRKLKEQNCQRILVVPMYPQYAASTTATVCDIVFDELQQMRNTPALRTIRQFPRPPRLHQGAGEQHQRLLDETRQAGKAADELPRPAEIHAGQRRPLPLRMPEDRAPAGAATRPEAGAVRRQLSSRASARPNGSSPTPAATLKELGKQKIKRVDVVCPGFVADCLETLEEIAMEGKEEFQHAGGGEYHYIPCLNDRNDWMHALTDLVLENLHGWLIEPDKAELEQGRLRALKMGAKK